MLALLMIESRKLRRPTVAQNKIDPVLHFKTTSRLLTETSFSVSESPREVDRCGSLHNYDHVTVASPSLTRAPAPRPHIGMKRRGLTGFHLGMASVPEK
ncbi:hypothetical protein WG66_015119 [Moniliophthora roreri]|nr:hypothetical protein WG66_015119 [Moniliophthora roreri]